MPRELIEEVELVYSPANKAIGTTDCRGVFVFLPDLAGTARGRSDGGGFSVVDQDAFARRMVACWNACRGFPLEVLQPGCVASVGPAKKG